MREMFTSIAPRYDLLNHVLSMNIDRVWWNRTAKTFSDILQRPAARILDLCCGTGDMTFALQRRSTGAGTRIVGADFSHAMLVRATQKSKDKVIRWIEADALHLPFDSENFQLVTSAFGFRNLANYDRGLEEIYRVLATGGEVGILDFGEPQGLIGELYRFYFRRVLPAVGTLISGVSGPYAYLLGVGSGFRRRMRCWGVLRNAGFREVSWTPYTFGIAGLYRGKK